MKIKQLKSNVTEVIKDNSNIAILYSYETPVAYKDGYEYFKVDKFYSKTTSRHINDWIGGSNQAVEELSEDKFLIKIKEL